MEFHLSIFSLIACCSRFFLESLWLWKYLEEFSPMFSASKLMMAYFNLDFWFIFTWVLNKVSGAGYCYILLYVEIWLPQHQQHLLQRLLFFPPVHWLTPQVATVACAKAVWSQKAGTSFGSPTWVHGSEALVYPALLSQGTSWELDGN